MKNHKILENFYKYYEQIKEPNNLRNQIEIIQDNPQ